MSDFKREARQIDQKFWVKFVESLASSCWFRGHRQGRARFRPHWRPNTLIDDVLDIVPDDEPLFLLRARDRDALNALSAYRNSCRESGCSEEQNTGIAERIGEFIRFRETHPERMKEPGSSYRKAGLPGKPAGDAA